MTVKSAGGIGSWGRRVARAAACLLLLASPAAARTRPEAPLFREAEQAESALRKSAKKQLKPGEWEAVVMRYRRIVARFPKSPYCDDALLAIGDLYRDMGKRFKRNEYLDDARAAYESLAAEYSSSSKRGDALYGVWEIARKRGETRRAEQAARAFLDVESKTKRAAAVRAAGSRPVAPEPARAEVRPAAAPAVPPREVRPVSQASEPEPPSGLVPINNVRYWSGETSTRVVLDLGGRVPFESDRSTTDRRVWLTLQGARVMPELAQRSFRMGDGPLRSIRLTQQRGDLVRLELDFADLRDHTIFWLDSPLRLVIDVRGQPKAQMAQAEVPAATPTLPARNAPAPAAVPSVAPPARTVSSAAPATQPPVELVTLPSTQTPRPAPPAPWIDEPATRPTEPARPASRPPAVVTAPAVASNERLIRLPPRRVGKLNAPWPQRPQASASTAPAPRREVVWTAPPARFPVPVPPPAAPVRTAERAPAVVAPPPQAPAPRNQPAPGRSQATVTAAAPPAPAVVPPPPQANRAGSYSLARQLGLTARRIVIDAGHGGHDPGSIGHGGLQEKDLTLDVALRVANLVRTELGAEVVMTRDTDVFVPLEERTAIANARGADLFLSVHANSSRNPRAKGIETYYLNFAPDPHAEEVAARENAISAATLKDLQHLVKAITLNSKIDESHDFAASVQESMMRDAGDLPNRGVRTAPFYVLIGANMPSVLAEIAFVSNPDEERSLKTSERRQRIAQGLADGVRAYLAALNRLPTRQLTARGRESKMAAKGVRR